MPLSRVVGTTLHHPQALQRRDAQRGGLLMSLRDHNPLLLRLVNMAMTLLYAVTADSFFRVTDCIGVPGAYASDDYDPTATVMRSDTSIACYRGVHAPVAVLAWVCLAVYLVAWPAVTFLYLVAVRLTNAGRLEFSFARRSSPWAFYCDGDYAWDKYYFRHALLLVYFVLAYAVTRSLQAPRTTLIISVIALGVYLALLLAFQPYSERKRWKYPIHVVTVVVSILLAVLNYVVYVDVEDVSAASPSPSPTASRHAWGLSWLVFLLIVGVLVVLVCVGWWYLLQGAERHADDLQAAVGVKKSPVAFSSIRWSNNPMKPRERLIRSIRMVVAGLRFLSPRSAKRAAAAAAAGGGAGAASGASEGAVNAEEGTVGVGALGVGGTGGVDVNMDKVSRSGGGGGGTSSGVKGVSGPGGKHGGTELEMTAVRRPKLVAPQAMPGGAKASSRTEPMATPKMGTVRVGTDRIQVPTVPPTAKAADSPTGKVHEALTFFKAPIARFRPNDADSGGKTGFHPHPARGAGGGGGSGGGGGPAGDGTSGTPRKRGTSAGPSPGSRRPKAKPVATTSADDTATPTDVAVTVRDADGGATATTAAVPETDVRVAGEASGGGSGGGGGGGGGRKGRFGLGERRGVKGLSVAVPDGGAGAGAGAGGAGGADGGAAGAVVAGGVLRAAPALAPVEVANSPMRRAAFPMMASRSQHAVLNDGQSDSPL